MSWASHATCARNFARRILPDLSGMHPETTRRVAQVRHAALSLMARTVAVPYWRFFVRNVSILFMLHRFEDSERGVEGVTSANLRSNLAFLRRHRFRLASFRDLLAEQHRGDEPRKPLVLFTVDDGHAEFATAAAPVFAEFDCPVTVFLTTGPIDGATWFWWDKVDYAISTTSRSEVQIEIGGETTSWRLMAPRDRKLAIAGILEKLKVIPNEAKLGALAALAERVGVDLPTAPPARHAAMSWADVRKCASTGVTFGPHTVTHPMLSQITDSQAEWEILESWRRLRAECDATVPVFCYPNGVYSPRDVGILRHTDLVAAVTTKPHYASRRVSLASAAEGRFHLPRFAYPTDHAQFVAIVTGLDRVNSFVREGRAGWNTIGTSS